jgi:hypothetical protein
MRRAWSLALLAWAACSDDGTPNNVDPDDIDGDGVLNDVDLCPARRDPAQHDDDGDLVGDACDNCPATPNAGQADTTELQHMQFPDGVGDACDRRPTVADDTIARFFPFAEPAEANAFTGSGWTIANDRASATTARWFSKKTELGDGITLQAKIAKLAWVGTDGKVSVVVDGDGVTAGFICALVHAPGGDTLEIEEIGGATTSAAVAPFQPTDGVLLTVTRAFTQLATGKAACFVGIGGGMETRIDIVTTDDLAIGSYALATEAADVELTSAIVMTTPFACDTPVAGPSFACPTP